MSSQELRDRNGSYIGRIETLSDGKMKLTDKHGSYKGYYDPKSDTTWDSQGRYVGKGNLLTMLLQD